MKNYQLLIFLAFLLAWGLASFARGADLQVMVSTTPLQDKLLQLQISKLNELQQEGEITVEDFIKQYIARHVQRLLVTLERQAQEKHKSALQLRLELEINKEVEALPKKE